VPCEPGWRGTVSSTTSSQGDAIAVEHPVARTFLRPEVRLSALDQDAARNRRGLEATLAELDAIEAICHAHSIRCLVLLIPTKESVYWELAREELEGASYDQLARLVAEEQKVRETLVRHLQARRLDWVDPLPALRAALPEERIYPANADGHPNGEGYRVIARAVLQGLEGADSR
jgi:hypothetical protein